MVPLISDKEIAGRNDFLTNRIGGKLAAGMFMEDIIREIVEEDYEEHKDHPSGPLFLDKKENCFGGVDPSVGAMLLVSRIAATSGRNA